MQKEMNLPLEITGMNEFKDMMICIDVCYSQVYKNREVDLITRSHNWTDMLLSLPVEGKLFSMLFADFANNGETISEFAIKLHEKYN